MQAPRHSRQTGSWSNPHPRATTVSPTSTAPDLVPPVRQPEPSSVQRTSHDSHRPQRVPVPLPPRPLPRLRVVPRRRDRPPLPSRLPPLPPSVCMPCPHYPPRDRAPLTPPPTCRKVGGAHGRARYRALPPATPSPPRRCTSDRRFRSLFPFSFSFPIVHTLIIALFLRASPC